MHRQNMTQAGAGTLALRVLAWLVASRHIDDFLWVSGLTPSDLRLRAQEPEVQAGVLAYLLSNEPVAAEYCEAESVPAHDLHVAHLVLGEAH